VFLCKIISAWDKNKTYYLEGISPSSKKMSTLFRQENNTSFFLFACLTFVYFVNTTSVQPKGEEEIQEEEQLQVSETKHKGYGGGEGYSQPIIYMVPYTVPSYGGYGGQGGYGGGGWFEIALKSRG